MRNFTFNLAFMPKFIPSLMLSMLLLSACQSEVTNNNISNNVIADAPIQIKDFAAHWLNSDIIMVADIYAKESMVLVQRTHSPDNKLPTNYLDHSISLTKITTPAWVNTTLPHLANFQSYSLEKKLTNDEIKQWLKQPLAVAPTQESSANSTEKTATKVQIAQVLDTLYSSSENDANEITDFGASIKAKSIDFKLWAPTALTVKVLLFEKDKTPSTPAFIELKEDKNTGAWVGQTSSDLLGKYYRYELTLYHPTSDKVETITVTDPYSLSLSTNSKYSHIVDLNDESTMPDGWLSQQRPSIAQPEDNIFYESHIRDFSAYEQNLSTPEHRGKYLAFSETNSDGIKHLTALRNAGINSVHLLPTFDIGTVNEDSQQAIDIQDPIKKLCDNYHLVEHNAITQICSSKVDNEQSIQSYISSLANNDESRQEIISAIRSIDNYNWGYDPYHYNVPEGSYAVDPEGSSRIVEFRTMVQSLHNLGFRVIMDVVYNHTHQAGLAQNAILDKIVPNYYHRLDAISGKIAQSTCCDNTATEHAMMEKLMIDSLIVWAKDYKIDGFRFDLMAHQPKSAMLKARTEIQKIDPDNYFYGEGWNFGEVANDQRFEQASQLGLAGTEIGTFTDRLRDAVRGGAFSASGSDIRKSQGIGNGLATINNDLQTENTEKYLVNADLLRLGLTGNLANYPLQSAEGITQLGKEFSYGDQPAGYALDPADTINYVSKHDNQTLWDNNQYRIAYHVSTKDRVRMQTQSLAFAIFSQGIPFIHMGSELLRSKGFLRDSYDYGDWFNKVDFSKQTNNYNIGLPPKDKDQANWDIISTILTNNEGRDIPSAADIEFSSAMFMELIKIRMSSPLFRLTTAKDIIEKVSFHNTGENQTLGLFVMSISGDEHNPSQLVVFNTSAETQHFTFSASSPKNKLIRNSHYELHPVLQHGIDPQVKQSTLINNKLTVPALTTAVFVAQKDK